MNQCKRLSDCPVERLAQCRGAPVPPAGDVEVLGWIVSSPETKGFRASKTAYLQRPDWAYAEDNAERYAIHELVDRAEFTRLTAERDGLENEFDAAANWDAAQLKVIHGLSDDVARLQSELTRARELNEHLSIALSELNSTLRVVAVAGSKTALSSLRTLAKRSLNIAHGLLSEQSAPTPFIAHNVDDSCGQDATCRTCNGTKVVPDVELTCSSGGIPYENGPIECVKDCPDCGQDAEAAKGAPTGQALRDLESDTPYDLDGVQ